ncbi:MAG: flagellar basal body P-ring protein FlgI [Acidobacteriota bacterium]
MCREYKEIPVISLYSLDSFWLNSLLFHCLLLFCFTGICCSVAYSQEGRPRRAIEQLTVRVKDVAQIEGVRENQLIGYGIVIGLNRTGDRVQQNLYTRQTLQNLLERMGITTRADSLKPENMATVLITAALPPFARQGAKIDVTVSSIADARSLQGGTLILSPLKGVDGQIYALAQGPVSIGGISAGSRGNSVEVNHPTVGRVPNGAIVERTVAIDLASSRAFTLVLRDHDFSTASRLQRVVNEVFGEGCAQALDGRNVEVKIPIVWQHDTVGFIAKLESIQLQTDTVAKVVINERTGTIVVGRNVRLAAVAISQGGVTVRIGTEFAVSQPAPLSNNGETVVTPRTNVRVEENKATATAFPDGATVEEVVRGLRAVGVTTRGIISVLQAIKSAGALNAELEMQ